MLSERGELVDIKRRLYFCHIYIQFWSQCTAATVIHIAVMWARYKYKVLLNIHADKTPHVKVFFHEHDELMFRGIYSNLIFAQLTA